MNEIRKIIEKTLKFIVELWKYGVHEKTFKISFEMGILNNKIILIDIGEITDNKKIAEKQIMKKSWEGKHEKHLPKKVSNYLNKKASEVLTINTLNDNWGLNEN